MTDPRPESLTAQELVQLIRRVFDPRPEDRSLRILVDLPSARRPDRPAWRERRALAAHWRDLLVGQQDALGLAVELVQYENAGTNNGDLPSRAWVVSADEAPADHSDGLDPETSQPFEDLLADSDILLAPTELSATAPLKVAARRHGFRAATMPGFSPAMVPALRLDYREVDRRVRHLAELLTRASGADLRFRTAGAEGLAGDGASEHHLDLHLDLRHRAGHASGGLLTEPGTAGNLPSGESYIVPYEGEREGDPSRSQGRLPVELAAEGADEDGGGEGAREVVVYRIEENQAKAVETRGPVSRAEGQRLVDEPAYGNLAELGLGVLADFGLEPIGTILLDEKLGLHIAFGRSEHFGGITGPDAFTAPDRVVHIDRVYLPQLQPRVIPERVTLTFEGSPGEGGEDLVLLEEGRWVEGFWG